ncbi:IS200/IS605 family element RNA-guided endonuclease TnpB [Nostoc sp. NMS4]|uniref:IS200/IS605 family element RNA-guided endonuclease TnpB n=1 Tax=Nostoc sp. NMS4 TaxID=2815390 RepID=UPI0025D5AD8D|nr:IS200/IS605 family element RNA-guided endonuclease TnpB [Nostoc sp. NMS4]MBN3922041.1 IS200/IS605 family element transposase accessory protein TnpB [Nostoc sp. NMS4]
MQKAFKVTLIPNHNQEVLINKTIGCARYVYNRFLAYKIELYASVGKTLNYNACSQQLTILKKEIEWLKEVDKFALQNSLKNLETAYKNFFTDLKKIKGKKGVGFPKFKKKHGCKQSYKTNLTNGNIQVIQNRLKLPKCGWVKFHKSQEITGKLVNVTITRTSAGKYIASILCETEIEKYPQTTQNIGLDLGLKSYLTTSNGETVDNPKHYKTQQGKLRKAYKELSRSVKGSNNRVKAKNKLGRAYKRITNLRDDFLHKLSTRLIKENSIICIEDLRVANMVKNHKLALSISDASWTKFITMLEYKALWHDRLVQKVGTFYPSSQTCNHCDFINHAVKDLKLREWSCPQCNSYNLRDKNAALNILSEGLRLIAAVGAPDAKNACGELVRPGAIQAQIVEAGIA